jgi:hypothetical protein
VQGARLDEIKGRALEALRETVALVDQKAPGEAKTFNGWLAQIANTVAEAGTEGGFLGFGGVKASYAERATLSEISQTRRVSAHILEAVGITRSGQPLRWRDDRTRQTKPSWNSSVRLLAEPF